MKDDYLGTKIILWLILLVCIVFVWDAHGPEAICGMAAAAWLLK